MCIRGYIPGLWCKEMQCRPDTGGNTDTWWRIRLYGHSRRLVAHPDDEVMPGATGRFDPDLVIERLLHQGTRQRGVHADPAAGGVELVSANDAVDLLPAGSAGGIVRYAGRPASVPQFDPALS